MYPVQVCCVWNKTVTVGLLKPGRNTKSMTLRRFWSTLAGRSRMKLGEKGISLSQKFSIVHDKTKRNMYLTWI
jgi:hypothetical protein